MNSINAGDYNLFKTERIPEKRKIYKIIAAVGTLSVIALLALYCCSTPDTVNLASKVIIINTKPKPIVTPVPIPVIPTIGSLTKGAIATQSSNNYNPEGSADKAIDGGKDSAACNWSWGSTNSVTHTNPEANPWWKMEMPTSKFVTSVITYNREDGGQGRLSNYLVRVGDNVNHKLNT